MDFNALKQEVLQKTANKYKMPLAFGIARQEFGQKNTNEVISLDFASVNFMENENSALVFINACLEKASVDFAGELTVSIDESFISACKATGFGDLGADLSSTHKNARALFALADLSREGLLEKNRFVFTAIFDDAAPKSIQALYLKLHLLSLQKTPPRSLDLSGAFSILKNLAWSGRKAYELDWLREKEIELKLTGNYPAIDYVDKFPRFLMHVIPAQNTRILDTAKVRMGAFVSDGTTVMPGAAYINFNAGTLGSAMVEGRVSSSAVVGAGSDVGGGASILGVLSGTDGTPISIGENCLLGANSTTGISLGDACIVDAGIAVLEGSKVRLGDEQKALLDPINDGFFKDKPQNIFKAHELSGLNGLHFRQSSLNGGLICLKSKREVKLNKDLH
ncbi:MAG: tetrahydrodipicolinate N-succinyltransferase N-terminal domain-containing protein [Helicobacteraceae bacterium]